MTRTAAIEIAMRYFDERGFHADLARRVAIPTESQNPERGPELRRYLEDELTSSLGALGFRCDVFANAVPGGGPFLVASRIEDIAKPTVLSYGHGDVIRGLEAQWRDGLMPWVLKEEGDRLYGRGTADNKGQHTVNIGAFAAVLKVKGSLGFNAKLLIETGEEVGSTGLEAFCETHRELLAADVFIASDGPRLAPSRPTIFLGSRGVIGFDLTVDLREGAHHSGNWGGLLADPGIVLAHAIASIIDRTGAIRIPEWRPASIPRAVRDALKDCAVSDSETQGQGAPAIDAWWGEPGLSAAEKLYGWPSFSVLAFKSGNAENPVNAIPPKAWASCSLRFVVGIDGNDIVPALERHLKREGFDQVKVTIPREGRMRATRLDPDSPWVHWAVDSIRRTTGSLPAILPNLGGSLPNDIFSETLGLPTLWVPHSYAACSQHAPNEHMLGSIAREGLAIMAGLFFDLGEESPVASIRRPS